MFIIVASVNHCVLGDLKFFNKITFLAQRVSAQKLSALFPFRQFFSVANLNFKCFVWHVRLH